MPGETTAIIVAAGRGTRVGGELPKQWQMLAGKPVLQHAIAAFDDHRDIHRIVVVLHSGDMDRAKELKASTPMTCTEGGETRDASVLNGLRAAEANAPEFVMIHDAARPLMPPQIIDRLREALRNDMAAAPALQITDALWTGETGKVTGLKERTGLYRAQTPQAFRFSAILSAHLAHSGGAADDVEVARNAGLSVAIVEGDERNFKITLPGDIDRAETLLKEKPMRIRTGNGFDVHRFGPGNRVTLCGIEIPHDRALQGHSDADVGMHAVTDAIYGALGEGDIGQHFPPSDPQWKGAASEIFLRHAVDLASNRGFEIGNSDCTLVCEYPKIGPHQNEMKGKMANIMRVRADQISVKATTSERLGFTGRGEGIAALATVTLVGS